MRARQDPEDEERAERGREGPAAGPVAGRRAAGRAAGRAGRLPGLLDVLRRGLVCGCVVRFWWYITQGGGVLHAVGEEDAVQVIDLVLERPGQQPLALDTGVLAAAVLALGGHGVGPRHLADVVGQAQAALFGDLLVLAPLDDLRD